MVLAELPGRITKLLEYGGERHGLSRHAHNANSGDVCRFEHFIDTVSRFPEITSQNINVIGVYIAWRGVDVTVPVAKFLTFWSRKSAGATIAAQNGCLATISELALAARAPDKKSHHCVLLGHSFGGLVLENTISHSILDASSTGSRNTSPWRRWQFVFTGNARVPCWIVRVPKEIIWGHGGLWSDNSVAMLAALFRMHFPLTAEGKMAPPPPRLVPRTSDEQQLNQDKLR
jgi:hypothetical protein